MGERKKKPRRKLKEGCQDTEQVESMTSASCSQRKHLSV